MARKRRVISHIPRYSVANYTEEKIVLANGVIIMPMTVSPPMFENEIMTGLKNDVHIEKKDRVLMVGTPPLTEKEKKDIGDERLQLLLNEVASIVKERSDYMKKEGKNSSILKEDLLSMKKLQVDLAKRKDSKDEYGPTFTQDEIVKAIQDSNKYFQMYKELKG